MHLPSYERTNTDFIHFHLGLTLASRISENKDVTVAVLESGPNANDQFVVYAPGM